MLLFSPHGSRRAESASLIDGVSTFNPFVPMRNGP